MSVKRSSQGTPALFRATARRIVELQQAYPPDACWPWSESAVRRDTYGRVKAENFESDAHRLSYILASGPIPPGMIVRHTCDFKPCANPTHLLAGTYSDNMQDALRRCRIPLGDDHYSRLQPERLARGDANGARTRPDRVPRGDRHMSRTKPETVTRGVGHGMAKLNDQAVRDIRRRYAAGGVRYADLAAEYGISKTNICDVVRGSIWKHVA